MILKCEQFDYFNVKKQNNQGIYTKGLSNEFILEITYSIITLQLILKNASEDHLTFQRLAFIYANVHRKTPLEILLYT